MSKALSSTGRHRDEINYERSKKNFLKLVEHKLAKHKRHHRVFQLHTKRRIEHIIAQKLKQPLFNLQYQVLSRAGRNILVTKRKTTESYKQILPWDEIFDIFMPIHIRTGHQGSTTMEKEAMLFSSNNDIEYKFPKVCLPFFRRVCSHCAHNTGKYTLLKTCKTGIVHVVPMIPTRSNEKFRYLLIYADKETHYTILRPIIQKTCLEIAGELYKIFTQFGPPMFLQIHGYNPSLTENIHKSLADICPEFKIETDHHPGRYELPTLVTDRIQDWMNKTKCLEWEVGCYIIQAEMNNDPKRRPSRISNPPHCTPYMLYFHTNMELDEDVTSTTDCKTDSIVIDLTEQESDQNVINKESQISKDSNQVSINSCQINKENQTNKFEVFSHNREIKSATLESNVTSTTKQNVTNLISKPNDVTNVIPEIEDLLSKALAKILTKTEYSATGVNSKIESNVRNVGPETEHQNKPGETTNQNHAETVSVSKSHSDCENDDMPDNDSVEFIDSGDSCSSIDTEIS